MFLTELQIYRVNITLSKKRFQHRYFLVNSTKFFITQTSFKEPFRRLLPQKHSFCLLSHHDLLFFQKRCNKSNRNKSKLNISNSQAVSYFEPIRTSPVELSFENSQQLRSVKYFCQKSSLTDVRQGSKNASVSSH